MMKKTSIIIDDITRKSLDDYCAETGTKLSDAIRGFIKKGIDLHSKEKELGYKGSVGINSLMVNQRYAIRASIESTLILRKLAKSMLKEGDITDDIDADIAKIMKSGWQYDVQS